ncbi:helix-turn-helix domain-containing protein [Klenkia soli]|uniref:helix-turn-helix domain-containing protein n=1 Tax=Klenkia soli TaxID=1052260 RepID=UPI000D69122F
MTSREAAALLRTTPGAVRARARRGSLPGAYRVGRDWHVPLSTVVAVMAQSSTTQPRRTRAA